MNHQERLADLKGIISNLVSDHDSENTVYVDMLAVQVKKLIDIVTDILTDLERVNDTPIHYQIADADATSFEDEQDAAADLSLIRFTIPGICNGCGEDELLDNLENDLCVDCYAERYGDYDGDGDSSPTEDEQDAFATLDVSLPDDIWLWLDFVDVDGAHRYEIQGMHKAITQIDIIDHEGYRIMSQEGGIVYVDNGYQDAVDAYNKSTHDSLMAFLGVVQDVKYTSNAPVEATSFEDEQDPYPLADDEIPF